MNKREFARYSKAMQKPDLKPTAFGVYLWRGDGAYQHAAPTALYKTEHSAQRKADKLNQTTTDSYGYVVRPIYGETKP